MGVSPQCHRTRTGSFNGGSLGGGIKGLSKCDQEAKGARRSVMMLVFTLLGYMASLELGEGGKSAQLNKIHLNKGEEVFKEVKVENSGKGMFKRSSWLDMHGHQVRDHNFEAHCKNGNRNKGSLKIASWNKGPAFLGNKMCDVENIIKDHQPHILGITEANLKADHNQSDIQIEGYKIFLADTIKNKELEYSRVVVYVKEEISCKIRHDLMTETNSSIWLEVKLDKTKFLVCQAYREWTLWGQGTETRKPEAQMLRWIEFLDQWERALSEGRETLVLGDLNLDWMQKGNSNYKWNLMMTKLEEVTLPNDIFQLILDSTWMGNKGEVGCLDHIYSNRPEYLTEVKAHNTGGSDHKLIMAVKSVKSSINQGRTAKKRCFKKFDKEAFLEELSRTSFLDIYLCSDVNIAASLLTQKLTTILDKHAPIKTKQLRNHYSPWVDEVIKDKMRE
jgi:hypothetical protein